MPTGAQWQRGRAQILKSQVDGQLAHAAAAVTPLDLVDGRTMKVILPGVQVK